MLKRILPLLVVLAPSSVQADEDALWVWSTRAVGFMVEGKLPEAVHAVAQARNARAAPELDALVGLAAMAGGQYGPALKQLRRAMAGGSTEPEVFYWAGRAALAAGDRAAALKNINRAIAVGGDRPAYRMAQAILLKEAGKRRGAVQALRAVSMASANLLDPSLYPMPAEGAVDMLGPLLRKFPHKDQLLRTQAHFLWGAGRHFRAFLAFKELARTRPRDGGAHQMLAQCQAQLHMRGEALASAAKAVDLDPDAGAARAIRGELLLRGGEARRAVTDLKLAADLLPREAEVLLRLALSCQKAEDARCARRFFRFALARDASLAEAHFGLALVDQQAGKLKEAWPSFKRAIALDPGNSRYYAGVAHFANLQKKAAAAASWLAEARRAGRLEKKLAKAAARNRKATTAMLELISWLKEGKECDLGCRKLLARLPRPAARFARAHLLGRSGGKKGAISAHLASVLGHLKSDKLFRTDPTKVEVRGRTVRGKNYVTKKSYPLVRLQALR